MAPEDPTLEESLYEVMDTLDIGTADTVHIVLWSGKVGVQPVLWPMRVSHPHRYDH